jgi:acyl carrier protein
VVAYVRAAEETPEAAELRLLLQEQLPEYMVPGTIVFLDQLPLSPSGKVDRKRLPTPQPETRERSPEVLAPSNAAEQLIAAAWSQVLEENIVSVNDNFFDLGGHSLMLIQVLAILRETLDASIAAVDLFRYPTIRLLAVHLDRQAQQQMLVGVHP